MDAQLRKFYILPTAFVVGEEDELLQRIKNFIKYLNQTNSIELIADGILLLLGIEENVELGPPLFSRDKDRFPSWQLDLYAEVLSSYLRGIFKGKIKRYRNISKNLEEIKLLLELNTKRCLLDWRLIIEPERII